MEAEAFEFAFGGQLMDMIHKPATNHLIQHAVKVRTMKKLELVTAAPVVSNETLLQ
jgi:hypothetical protein